jgi:hypothetical protein
MKKILIASLAFIAFTVHAQNVTVDFNKVIVNDFAGFGTQYNQNVYSTFSSVDGITPENIGQLEAKVKNLKSQYVRIFFDPKSWKSDPNYSTVPSDFMESFIKTVKLAQDAGAATINITYWSGPTPEKMSAFANLMYELIVNRKLTSAREVTIQNEPNGHPGRIDLSRYKACYDKLDVELKAKGIRNRVRIVGGDLVSTDQKYWFDYMTANMTNSLDGYSFHAYWDDNDTIKPGFRLTSVANIAKGFTGQAVKPVYITEYGVRGSIKPAGDIMKDPGYLTGTMIPISRTTTSALQNALFQINGMNLGFAGFIRWDCYKAKFDRGSQYYSCIGSAKDGYPLYPLYYMTYLFTHTCEPGWQVVKTSSGVDVHNTFVASAIKDVSGNNQTVYVINTGRKSTQFSMGGLTPNRKYNVYSFNSDGKGELKIESVITSSASGAISGNADANTLLAITTMKVKIK